MSTICIVAGKSGGHIVPGLTIAQQKKADNSDLRVIFFSTNSSLDKKIIDTAAVKNLVHYSLPFSSIPYRKPWKIPLFFYAFMYALMMCTIHLYRHKPSQVISMGGIISLPVCFAAFILNIPIRLYELNAMPGSAVTFLARFATTIHCCFDVAKKQLPAHKYIQTAYPIRYSVSVLQVSKHEARKKLGIADHKKTVLVLGGSQGSHFINNLIKNLFETQPWLAGHLHIIHQTGNDVSTVWHDWYAQYHVDVHTFTYHDDLTAYYQAADVVICRSGAGTLFETLFFNIPLITIPLETHTTDHQIYNARALAQQYPTLVRVLLQKEIEQTPTLFVSKLCSLLSINRYYFFNLSRQLINI
jgi:UDP-N-acetylglucosamine--N-acetylmuramyl-(pentapeptide) pyrophosphoryl-undecaprenol N-acetylglucosamine transferase